MISVAEARRALLNLVSPMDVEAVPLAMAAGRALAQTVHAHRTQPPFAASAMDGYALRGADLAPGARLRVIGTAQAGRGFGGTLGAGEAVRIFTGAPVPHGADTVLIQEDADRDGDTLIVREGPGDGTNIRAAGSDFAAGDPLAAPRRLTARDVALAAAMNHATLPVRRKPLVALIPTGDELVVPGEVPGPDQIVSSNSYGLKAMLDAAGAEARLLPIARDTPQSLRAVFALAADADLIVTLGGASVGDHDLVQETALGQGLDLSFYKVAMRPGKPLMAGRLGTAAMVGLPGNPVSAMVCGTLFLCPMIAAMLGLDPAPRLRRAVLSHDLAANGPREHYMRGVVDPEGHARVFDRQDSALLSVLQAANALVVRAPNAAATPAGTVVEWLPLD